MLSEQFLTFWCLALYWVIFWCLAYSDTHPLERIPSPRQTGTPSAPPLSQSLSGRPAPGEGRVMERVPLELQKNSIREGLEFCISFIDQKIRQIQYICISSEKITRIYNISHKLKISHTSFLNVKEILIPLETKKMQSVALCFLLEVSGRLVPLS